MRAGARGYLLKDISLERLAEAIRRVAAGETLVHQAVGEQVRRVIEEHPAGFDSLDEPDRLTPSEVQILGFLARVYSNREIADTLRTAESTVKNHISSVLSKMGVRDRTRAVLKAIEMGII